MLKKRQRKSEICWSLFLRNMKSIQKKRFLYAIFLLVLPLFVYGTSEELIYSGSVYPGQPVNISNEIYSFSLSASNDKLGVDLPSSLGFIVKDGSCEIKDYYKICFNGVESWYHNYTLDRDFYKASVDVYQIVSKIELTRTVEDTDLLIGEQTEIDLTIKNTEDRESTDIVYSDTIPSSFSITDVSGCVIEKINSTYNAVKWYGSLNKNLEKKCSYKLKALNKIKFNSKAYLSYNNGVKIVESYDSLKITVQDYQLNVTSKLDKEKVKLDQEINFNISLTNVNSENEIRVVLFEIEIPLGLKVITKPKYLNQDFTKYSWKGTLLAGESEKFNFKLKGRFINKYILKPKARFIISGISKEVTKPIGLEVYGDTPSFVLSANKQVLSGDKLDIVIDIKNPSRKQSFKDMVLLIESDLFGVEKRKISQLRPLESKEISMSFTAPEVESDKNYPIILSVSYKSEYNQLLKFKEEKTVTVIKEKEDIIIPIINKTNESIIPTADIINETNITRIVEKENISFVEENITPTKEEIKPKKSKPPTLLIIISVGTFFIVLLIVGIITIRDKLKEKK